MLDLALEKARRHLQGSNPLLMAARSGVAYESGRFAVPFFHRSFYLSFPGGLIEEPGREESPPSWLQLALLHYLLTADGAAVAYRWVSFGDLEGGRFYARAFEEQTLQPLAQALGNDLEPFRCRALALKGMPMSRGDAGFWFMALPRLPMACVVWLGDEELSPSATILFDASSHYYLPTEDLAVLGNYLGMALQGKNL